MVAIGLSAESVARVRFAVSCLWEVAASIRVLRDPGDHAIHLPWVNRVRPRLARAGLVAPTAACSGTWCRPRRGTCQTSSPRRRPA